MQKVYIFETQIGKVGSRLLSKVCVLFWFLSLIIENSLSYLPLKFSSVIVGTIF